MKKFEIHSSLTLPRYHSSALPHSSCTFHVAFLKRTSSVNFSFIKDINFGAIVILSRT